ncbi:uncharacterized protein LOC112592622 [Melanaphis sacchari]|uniref:uncharacterized protein LOC112592622 n=1 Tax=Melanaphis sacchari TaxID=742174 RepID=UPI000DC151AD|nr:uncharacterized protein LOC112592622 [Melanaphis sacchari]
MSIFFMSLILIWSQISGIYVVTLYVDGKNENMSTINNELCIPCFCKPKTSNCKEEICTDSNSTNLCQNETYQANTEHQAPASNYLNKIGFIFKIFICMCIIYMFVVHASRDCFDSISTRRVHSSLNQILSDDGLPSSDAHSDDQSCVMPLNVYEHENNINDPPPSYHDVQNTRTNVSNPWYTTLPPVQSSNLNYDCKYNVGLLLTSSIDEPPPSYDDFMAIHRSKLPRVYDNLLPNYAYDHLYTAMPVDEMETAQDLQTTFESETDILRSQV